MQEEFYVYVLICRESSWAGKNFRSLAVNQIWFLIKLALHNIKVGTSGPFARC